MEPQRKHIHKFIKTEIPSTCTERGYTLYRCECGAEHKESFKPLAPHDFVLSEDRAATCTEPGERIYKCSVCGENKTESIPPLGHKYGEWQTQAFATCTGEGKEIRICSGCGLREERSIKPKGHKLTNPQSSKTQKGMIEYFCENCGETVVLPSSSAKFKAFLKKKSTIAFISIFAFIAVAVASLFIFAKPIDYAMGKLYLNIGNYTKAYYRFIDCRGYRDTDEILDDFRIEYKNVNRYIYGNNNNEYNFIVEYEYEYDKWGNEISCNAVIHKEGQESYTIGQSEQTFDKEGDPTYRKDHHYRTLYGGGAKEAYSFVYDYDKYGNKIRRTKYDADGNVTQTNEYKWEYNKDGKETLYIEYFSDGSIREKKEWEYDKNGNETLYIEYILNGSNEIITYKAESAYNDEGKIINRVWYENDKENSVKYNYDSNGRYIGYTGDNSTCVYKYDKEGNIISFTETDNETNSLMSTVEYRGNGDSFRMKINYTESGIIDSIEVKDGIVITTKYVFEGKVNDRSEERYDKYGNLILENNSYVSYTEKTEVDYVYDENGILKERTDYYSKGDEGKYITDKHVFSDPVIVYDPDNKLYHSGSHYLSTFVRYDDNLVD